MKKSTQAFSVNKKAKKKLKKVGKSKLNSKNKDLAEKVLKSLNQKSEEINLKNSKPQNFEKIGISEPAPTEDVTELIKNL